MDLATAEPVGRRALPTIRPPRRRPGVREITAGIVALHLLAVGWLVSGGDLYIDDIRAQAYAAGRGPWPFIIESNRTHLAPGARTIDWFMATYSPLQHWPAVVLTIAIAALVGWSSRRLVRQVITHPGAQVLALSWVLFAASVIPTYAWFRQALTTMTALGLMILATSLLIDHLRTGRWQPVGWALALQALALTFSERALAVPVVVLALMLVARPMTPWLTWRRVGVALVPFVAVNLAFLAVYRSGDFDTAQGAQPSLRDAVLKIGRWAVVDLLPSFLGGPVTWRNGNGAYSFAATPAVLVVVSVIAFLALLAWASRTRGAFSDAAPVAVVAAAYALPVLGMIYVGRLAQVADVTTADDLRLLPDVSAVTAIAVAALVGAVLERRRSAAPAPPPRRARVLWVGAAVSVVTLTGITWISFGLRWHDTTVTAYLNAVRHEVPGVTGVLLPTPVPDEVIPGWVESGFTTAPLIELLNPAALASELPGKPSVIGPSGSLAPAGFTRVASAPVPDGFCGAVLDGGEQSITLALPDPAPYYRGSIVTLGLLVGDATRLNVIVTDRDGTVSPPLVQNPPELLNGPHRVYAKVPPGTAVAAITVVVETPNTAGVCVTSAQVETVGAGS